ncbi:MAG: transketolase [Patescibacteria group bacterium]|nr:transketolase [Patescibacteria group bacterium]
MNNNLPGLAKLIRYYILTSTTEAGSGHPTSSLSAVELMVSLMFGGYFRFDLNDPQNPNNDRLIFSKGHASPLFYALYAAAGQAEKSVSRNAAQSRVRRALDPAELMTLRKFGSRLEGHPTMQFPYTEVPTGSLGQGLSVGVGMAINAKYLDKLPYKTFVLLGDSEMAEGSVWEAMASAAFYKLDNLIAILDVNRLGQSRETMLGRDAETYKKRAESFGWNTIVVDGHNFGDVSAAYAYAASDNSSKPYMIIAKTVKGKGVSFLEDKEGWHGKALTTDDLKKALEELGEADQDLAGEVARPEQVTSNKEQVTSKEQQIKFTNYDKPTATRKAYGNALANIFEAYPNIVALDGETSNSTYSEIFRKAHPDKYFEMFIAEQNMAGVALGLARRGKIPFASTFAAFWSRAYDQIRMSQYAHANVKFCGSHAGVSIGEDGSSQMALEDIAMFRSVLGSTILYPSDAVSAEKLVAAAAEHEGNVYIRTTRKETAILYGQNEQFPIGGSKVLRSSGNDQITVVGAGITLHEALAAHEELKKEGINVRVIDLYSIKPLDAETLKKAAAETKAIITVEDHHAEGGLGEAVASALAGEKTVQVAILAVSKEPHSAKPAELLAYEEINAEAIIKKVKEILNCV